MLTLGGMPNISKLYLDYQPRLLNFVSRIVGSDQEAFDIVQDSFVKFSLSYDAGDEEAAAKLLFTIARNKCLDYLKSARNINLTLVPRLDALEISERLHQFSLGMETDAEILSKEVRSHIDEIVSALTPRCREVFEMRYVRGMKHSEIAAALGISVATVEKHVRTIKDAFRDDLADNPENLLRMILIGFVVVGFTL